MLERDRKEKIGRDVAVRNQDMKETATRILILKMWPLPSPTVGWILVPGGRQLLY